MTACQWQEVLRLSGSWWMVQAQVGHRLQVWHSAGQCIRATSISAVHQWYAWRHHEVGQDIRWWHQTWQSVQRCANRKLYADNAEGCGLTVWLVSRVATKIQCIKMYTYDICMATQRLEDEGWWWKTNKYKTWWWSGEGFGVLFDRKLSFRQHIGSIVKKVNRMIGLTRRTFQYMDEEVFRLLYNSFCRDCTWTTWTTSGVGKWKLILASCKMHREEPHD